MEFTVKRSKWVRGNVSESALLNSHNNQCCLGFFASQYGVPDAKLSHRYTPLECRDLISPLIEIVSADEIEKYGSSFQHFLDGLFTSSIIEYTFTDSDDCIFDNTLTTAAVEINDDDTITDADREHRLTMLFDLFGHTIKFID